MNKYMKTKSSILVIAIITIVLSGGCIKKEEFDFKMTIEPQTVNYSITSDIIAKTSEIIKKRLNNYGIAEENINLEISENKIYLTLNKIDTGKTAIIEKLVTVQGKIGFWETYENSELIEYLINVNKLLLEINLNKENKIFMPSVSKKVTADTIKSDINLPDQLNEDILSTDGDASREEFINQNPLFGILMPRLDNEGKPLPSCMIGLSAEKDTAKVNGYFKMKEVKALFPRDIRFYWSHSPYPWDNTKSLYEFHAIKVNTFEGKAPVGGDVIVSAKAVTNKYGTDVRLNISMNSEGARIWARMTKDNINRCIAVVLDGYVRSYPRVMNEITGGNTEITGDFSLSEVQYLAAILGSGENGLPTKLQVSEKQIIKKE
jgi:SecD/SecF fusion protein